MKTPLEKYNFDQNKKFQNYITNFIEKDENLNWNWLSRIQWIDIDFVLKYKNKPWNSFILSYNSSISKEDKEKTKHMFTWHKPMGSVKSMEEYNLLRSEVPKNSFQQRLLLLNFFCNDKNIVNDVELYPDFPWDWSEISTNLYITEEFVLKYRHNFDFNFLSANKAMSISFIKNTFDFLPWDNEYIFLNPNLQEADISYFYKIKKCEISIKRVCQNEKISIQYLITHFPNLLHWEWLSVRTDLSDKDIITNPNAPWCWHVISKGYSKNISKQFLLSHPKVDKTKLYKYYDGFTVDEILHCHPNEIDGSNLQGTLEDKMKYLQAYYAVRVISNAFYNCYWFVDYAYCRKRLNKRYDELFEIQS